MNIDVSRNHEDETSYVSTGESVEELPFGHGVVNKRFTYHDVTFHADQHEIPGTDEYVSPEHALTVPCVANDEIAIRFPVNQFLAGRRRYRAPIPHIPISTSAWCLITSNMSMEKRSPLQLSVKYVAPLARNPAQVTTSWTRLMTVITIWFSCGKSGPDGVSRHRYVPLPSVQPLSSVGALTVVSDWLPGLVIMSSPLLSVLSPKEVSLRSRC